MMKKTSQQTKQLAGMFGQYGGRVVPPALEKNLAALTTALKQALADKDFMAEYQYLLREYANRPSGLYEAKNYSKAVGGAKIVLKREDLNHTGSHKINNAIGQALLAKRMGKTQLLAETGAGQHGVAVATVAALLGLQATIYMGQRDGINQAMNVDRMRLLGAKVVLVTTGQATLKDAVDAALSAYITDPTAYYLLGSAVGPHPYPTMVREFQKVIGIEAKQQVLARYQQIPDAVVACVGGGSNALGLFTAFLADAAVKVVAAEPAGLGRHTTSHGLSLLCGQIGTIHGYTTRVLHTKTGEIAQSYSAASGLDYPGVSPELSDLYDQGRVMVEPVTDLAAVASLVRLARTEGVIAALESAHALAAAERVAKKLGKNALVLVNLSGRGDKDVGHLLAEFPDQIRNSSV